MDGRTFVAAVAVATVVAVGGCTGSDEPSAESSPLPTSLAGIEPEQVRLARAEFCDLVPRAAVRRALDAEILEESAWANGDPSPTGAAGDVAHEHGCAWTASGGAAVRAWVFARPVAADMAAALVEEAGARGCAVVPEAFGEPSYLRTCPQAEVPTYRRAGLFGDTWLTCELAAPGPEASPRLDAWCATVLSALDTA